MIPEPPDKSLVGFGDYVSTQHVYDRDDSNQEDGRAWFCTTDPNAEPLTWGELLDKNIGMRVCLLLPQYFEERA